MTYESLDSVFVDQRVNSKEHGTGTVVKKTERYFKVIYNIGHVKYYYREEPKYWLNELTFYRAKVSE